MLTLCLGTHLPHWSIRTCPLSCQVTIRSCIFTFWDFEGAVVMKFRFAGVEYKATILTEQKDVKKALHEHGSLPALKTEEGTLTGTTTIARYFARVGKSTGSSKYGELSFPCFISSQMLMDKFRFVGIIRYRTNSNRRLYEYP